MGDARHYSTQSESFIQINNWVRKSDVVQAGEG